jgi:lipopolysaccharide/colanic/teichoic acid biosynthesis glycosyltransferase
VDVTTATPLRAVWESRYVAWLAPVDVLVGVAASGLAVLVQPAPEAWLIVVLPLAWLAALFVGRAYETRCLFVGNEEYQRVVRAGLALTTTIAIVLYAFDVYVARGYLLVAMPALVALGLLGRYGMRVRLRRAWQRGECLRRVAVVGHPGAVAELTRRLDREPHHGLLVVVACRPGDAVADQARRVAADTVVVLPCPELDGAAVRRLAWQLEHNDIDLIMASALIDVAGPRTTLRPVDGLPMLHVEHPHLRGVRRVVKSVADRCAAAAALVLLAPLFLAIAVAVRWQPGAAGPALARKLSIGRAGRQFRIYKFRARADSVITPVGRWLRRYSLEGLPRLINVLRGDMSLVGPPPWPPPDGAVVASPADVKRRLVVKPGLTGLWRISGGADLAWEEAMRLDLRYVENWSLTLDLVIVFRTITAVVRSSASSSFAVGLPKGLS